MGLRKFRRVHTGRDRKIRDPDLWFTLRLLNRELRRDRLNIPCISNHLCSLLLFTGHSMSPTTPQYDCSSPFSSFTTKSHSLFLRNWGNQINHPLHSPLLFYALESVGATSGFPEWVWSAKYNPLRTWKCSVLCFWGVLFFLLDSSPSS